MRNGKFTKEEREYLISLDAVDRVNASQIIYNKDFKRECMRRYAAGESPAAIFAQAGLPSSLIGYKRIERAIYHWKEAERKDALTLTEAPLMKRDSHIKSLKTEKRRAVERQRAIHDRRVGELEADKRRAVERQRAIRDRQVSELEARLAKQKERFKRDKDRIIASQAAEIAALKAQVKALKANGTLARTSRRAPGTTKKSERFEVIFLLKSKDPDLNISAACEALEVSRSGYYDWVAATDARAQREAADESARDLVAKALAYRGFRKGSRQVAYCLFRTQGVHMNRKKVQRLMQKYGLITLKKKRPYHHIGSDGLPKVADNVVNRNFKQGAARRVLSTDITYLPNKDGFSYTSAFLDCETKEVLAHVTSDSLEEKFVLDSCEQLKGVGIDSSTWICSDQGSHYTSRLYRDKLVELKVNQSMSRKACCWDNAPIESFWGRMKEQIGSTAHLSHKEIVALVDDYVDYYNNERGQVGLNWLTPTEYAQTLA